MWHPIAASLLTLALALGMASPGWAMATAQTLELNQASEVDLDSLRGVGPALTQELLRERQKKPFQDWHDVTRRVKGLGPHKANNLSEQGVRVQGQAFTAAPPAPSVPAAGKRPGPVPH